MISTQQVDHLIDGIATALSEYRFTERETGELGGIPFEARIMTPRTWAVRYVCAISRLPNDVTDVPACQGFFEGTRKCLTREYALFPWWKELGTYSVMLCNSQLFGKLSANIGAFKDRTGLHMNVMLGTCFIDVEHFRSSADSTWGLYHSGKHLGAVREVVRQWCVQCRDEAPSP